MLDFNVLFTHQCLMLVDTLLPEDSHIGLITVEQFHDLDFCFSWDQGFWFLLLDDLHYKLMAGEQGDSRFTEIEFRGIALADDVVLAVVDRALGADKASDPGDLFEVRSSGAAAIEVARGDQLQFFVGGYLGQGDMDAQRGQGLLQCPQKLLTQW
ncbi:MAG: hypothetical protein AseanaTS_16590 [Candidatus Pelagadaptatus aseana]